MLPCAIQVWMQSSKVLLKGSSSSTDGSALIKPQSSYVVWLSCFKQSDSGTSIMPSTLPSSTCVIVTVPHSQTRPQFGFQLHHLQCFSASLFISPRCLTLSYIRHRISHLTLQLPPVVFHNHRLSRPWKHSHGWRAGFALLLLFTIFRFVLAAIQYKYLTSSSAFCPC